MVHVILRCFVRLRYNPRLKTRQIALGNIVNDPAFRRIAPTAALIVGRDNLFRLAPSAQ